MPLNIRERSQKVADCIKTKAGQTLKTIAASTRLHPSSVHRHRQGISRRNQYPESSFWETEAGYRWLTRLVFGLVYDFGVKQGVGAESLSAFIQAMHLDTHVASSASSLRTLKQRVEQGVIDYGQSHAENLLWLAPAGTDRTGQRLHLRRNRMREPHLCHLDGASQNVVDAG